MLGEKKEKLRWLLLCAGALSGIVGGIFLYRCPENALFASLGDGLFCGFQGGIKMLALCYLLLCLPILLLFCAMFGGFLLPESFLILLGKGILSGYCAVAFFDLRPAGSGGVLLYLLYLLSEGETMILCLSYARWVLRLRDRESGNDIRQLAADGGAQLLLCCGILILVLLLRTFVCGRIFLQVT